MAEYVLLADYFRQAVERDDKGNAVKVVKRSRGDVLTDLSDEDADRLLKAGAIRSVDDVEPEADTPADEPEGDDTPPVESGSDVERPKRAATKDAWVEYAASKGFDRDQAEAMSKDDLIAALG